MHTASQPVVTEVSGSAAHLQRFCLGAAAGLSSLVHNRGMQRFTWAVAPLFDSRNTAVLELPAGGKLQIYLNDGYWARLLVPGFVYEPEIQFILKTVLTQPDTYFLDCGSNIGYWSVVASQTLPPGHTIAFEASPSSYEQLHRNAELNHGRFDTVLAAIWSRDGDTLNIVTHDKRHAGSSVVNRREKTGQKGYHEYRIESLTIDSICSRYIPDPDARVVIKLDIEGAELQAIAGADQTLRSREVVLIYEDHGQDSSCEISDLFINGLGLDVFYCHESGAIARMNSIADVRAVKTSASTGYNFSACSTNSVFSRLLSPRSSAR
jgi:FkbM family methyltransferase